MSISRKEFLKLATATAVVSSIPLSLAMSTRREEIKVGDVVRVEINGYSNKRMWGHGVVKEVRKGKMYPYAVDMIPVGPGNIWVYVDSIYTKREEIEKWEK